MVEQFLHSQGAQSLTLQMEQFFPIFQSNILLLLNIYYTIKTKIINIKKGFLFCSKSNQNKVVYEFIIQSMEKLTKQESQNENNCEVILLMNEIIKHNEWLEKLKQQILPGLQPEMKYPFAPLLKAYSKLISRLKLRAKVLDRPKISDCFYMVSPDIIVCVFTAQYYLGKGLKLRSAKELVQKNTILEVSDLDQEKLLEKPLQFAKHKLPQLIQAFMEKIDEEKYRSDKQKMCLDNFLKWYSKTLKMEIDEDWVPDKKRRILILSQYSGSESINVMKKYGKRILFFRILEKRSKQVEKKINTRKMKILQLIDGENKYINGLKQYISGIKEPIQNLNILSEEQKKKIFSSIVSIKQFHQQLTQNLQKRYNQYHKYQKFGDIIKKFIPFFKLYVDYILAMNDGAVNDLMKLEATNSDIQNIIRKFMDQKQKKATDEITQPTFRIARYQALFSEIIKKTSLQHPDYQLMVAARDNFLKIIGGVNKTVDKIVRKNKLNQLEEQFGTPENPIFVLKEKQKQQKHQKQPEYLNQYEMFLIREDHLESVIVYIFTHLILIIDSNNRQILKKIPINQNYYVRRQQDTKTYKNLIKIHSDGFITLSGGAKDVNLKKTEQAFSLLCQVSQQEDVSNALTFVQVLGTEEIGSTSFAKHTQYIIEVKYLEFKKLLHLRFSDIQKIAKEMQKCYNDTLGIQSDQTLKKNWFNNHKSKTIEDRKRVIEQILQKLFNNKIIRAKPAEFLTFLGLDAEFFIIARRSMERGMSIRSSNTQTLTKKEGRQALMILCATEVKLGRDIIHADQEFHKQPEKNIEIEVQMMTYEPVRIKIHEFTTVEDICNKVSKLIGLRTNRDFRLFHEIGKKQLRVLDQEQLIMKIFQFKENESETSIFTSAIGSIKKIFSPETQPTLIFKKYYFLPFEIEQSEFKKDLTRLRLLVYQIFFQIKEMKYQFSFDQYLLFLAMMIYIQNQGKIQEIQPDIIHRIIPETIFKLKNYNQKEWVEKATYHIQKLHKQIQRIRDYNTEQLKFNQVKIDTPSKTALYFGHKHLCSQIVLNKIKSNPIYGSNLFYVQPHKLTYDKLINQKKKMAYNMWLAIKVQSLTLLTPASKQMQLQLHYKNIQKIDVYSEAIQFKIDSLQSQVYRLNTYQSFEISQLVKYNKALNTVLDQIKSGKDKTSNLISKAKFYKADLQSYRLTHDNHGKISHESQNNISFLPQ